MKLTKLQKWGIAAAVAPMLLVIAFYVHSWLPRHEADPPPETGEVRDVPPSLFDRAISAYYERQADEPIVAIIRQDIIAQFGASISPSGEASSATCASRASRKRGSSGNSPSTRAT
jgi:hypothetical protein